MTAQQKAAAEQLQIAGKLLEILSPNAVRTRKEMVQRGGRFVHYTSAENGLKIINSRTIWMRNTNCMSDYREVQHGQERLKTFFSASRNMEEFQSALNACVDGVGKQAFNLFERWWSDIRFNTYITSLSEHHDSEDQHGRLSMWRAFAGTSARVALVFKIPLTEDAAPSLNLLMIPVAYHTDAELERELKLVIQNIKDNQQFLGSIDREMFVQSIFFMLVTSVVCLKHEGFQEEREWRVIYSPNLRPSPLISSSIEVIGGVPQTVYKIPLAGGNADLANLTIARLIDRVIIGPSQYPWPMWGAFVSVLTAAGVPDANQRVFVSGIPIRN
jgi:Protein of unknown function (DUF2971)